MTTPYSTKAKLSGLQTVLLNEIWDHHLATGEWPKTRVIHSRHDKDKTRAALERLGGSLVMEVEDHSHGHKYTLSAAAAILTANGKKYRDLLLLYFEYLRTLYHKEPEKNQVTSVEIGSALNLQSEELKLLRTLLQLRPFYDCGGAQTDWTAGIRSEVEDFPRTGELTESLDALLSQDVLRVESVFLDQRRGHPVDFSITPFHEQRATDPRTSVDALKRRYQVFVSSTYEDLKTERQHVMQALLETKCIPTGMELFPASSNEQWDLIRRVIDECDYYIVIVAGRYGSVSKAKISYTEQEFDYAVQIGKPVIGFYHRDPNSLPGSKLETGDKARAKLTAFVKKVKNRLCRPWTTPEELGSAVKSAILNELEFNPRPGWIRADVATPGEAVDRLKQRIADLEERLKRAAPKLQDRRYADQKKGREEVTIRVEASYWVEAEKPKDRASGDRGRYEKIDYTMVRTWDELLLLFSNSLKGRTDMESLKKELELVAEEEILSKVPGANGKLDHLSRCEISMKFFDRLIHTLAARKLIKMDLPRNRYGSTEMVLQFTPQGIARIAEIKAL